MRAAALKRDKHAVIGRPGGRRGADRGSGDPLRPQAAADAACAPREDAVRIVEREAEDPAVIGAAIAEMAAERDIERAPENRERAALVLRSRIEILPEPAQDVGDIDRPTRQHCAVTE